MTQQPALIEIVQVRLEDKELKLPIFNQTAVKLQQMMSREDFSIDKCAQLVSRDQALASQILKEANSSFFGGLKKINTIHDAMVRLGTKEVLRITMQVAHEDQYRCKAPELKAPMALIWKHSLGVAMGAYWLAQKTGFRKETQQAFLAGLLHDIGRLLIIKVLDELSEKGQIRKMSPDLVVEILDSLHVEQGYRLMKAWDIPDIYCEVIKHHHTCSSSTGPILPLLVQLANHACNKLGIGLHKESELVLFATPAAQALKVSETTLAELEILLDDKFFPQKQEANA